MFNNNRKDVNIQGRNNLLQCIDGTISYISEKGDNCADIRHALQNIRIYLESRSVSDSSELMDTYTKLTKLLGAIKEDIQSNHIRIAEIRIRVIKRIIDENTTTVEGSSSNLIDKKGQKAQKKFNKEFKKRSKKFDVKASTEALKDEDVYTKSELEEIDRELRNIPIDNLQNELNKYEKEYNDLVQVSRKNPKDVAIKSKLDELAMYIKSTRIAIEKKRKESNIKQIHDIQSKMIQDFKDSEKNLISKEESQATEKEFNDRIYGFLNDDGYATGNFKYTPSSVGNAQGNVGNMSGDVGNVSDNVGNLSGNGTQTNSRGYDPLGLFNGDNNNLPAGLTEEELSDYKKQLEKYNEQLGRELDKADSERDSCAYELKQRLDERKGQRPSEWVVSDTYIDKLRSKFNSIKQRINIIANKQATVNDRLSVINTALNMLMQGNAEMDLGLDLDKDKLNDIALWTKDKTKDLNKELEDAGTAAIIAGSEEIKVGSMSGTFATESESLNGDKDKYSDLEKELEGY